VSNQLHDLPDNVEVVRYLTYPMGRIYILVSDLKFPLESNQGP
jgi:hypothetical protein